MLGSMSFAKWLKKRRIELDLSQGQLATYSGLSDAFISQIETGVRGTPKPETLKKLVGPLKVSYEEIMQAAGYLPSDGEVVEAHELAPDVEGLTEEELQDVRDYIAFLKNKQKRKGK